MSAKTPKYCSLCIIFMICFARIEAYNSQNIGRPIRPPPLLQPSPHQPPHRGFYGALRPTMGHYGPQLGPALAHGYNIQSQHGPGFAKTEVTEPFSSNIQRQFRKRPFPKSRTPTGKRSRVLGKSRKNRGKSARKSKKKHKGKSGGRRKRRRNRD